MGYIVGSSIATVPSTDYDWYVFLLEDHWNDILRSELSSNFDTLARELGPKRLAVRGLDRDAMRRELALTYGRVFDSVGALRRIDPPALLVTDTAPRVVQALPPEAVDQFKLRVMVFPLRSLGSEPGRTTNFLALLVKSLGDDAAMKALERSDTDEVKSFWGWVRFLHLKPNFFGIGLNLNEIFERLDQEG